MSGPPHCLSSPGAGDCSAKENLERGTSEPQVKVSRDCQQTNKQHVLRDTCNSVLESFIEPYKINFQVIACCE